MDPVQCSDSIVDYLRYRDTGFGVVIRIDPNIRRYIT